MLLRSVRIYPPKHLNMSTKLNLILKGLQDLKFRVDVLENKKGSCRDDTIDRRDENTNRRREGKNDITRRIKILSHLTVFLTQSFLVSGW